MTRKKKFVIIFIALTIIVVLAQLNCHAQTPYYQRINRKTYLGIDGSLTTKANAYHSDLSSIKNIKDMELGGNVGIFIGKSWYQVKLKVGSYKTSGTSELQTNLKTSGQELTFNFFPLALLPGKPGLIDVYAITGLERNSTQFSGTYVPAQPTTSSSGSGSTCSCTCPNATPPTPPSPALSADPTSQDSQPYSGNLNTMRLNLGAGIQIHVPGPKNFANLFAQAKYGIQIDSSSPITALRNTSALNQLTVEFGIAYGIIKKRKR